MTDKSFFRTIAVTLTLSFVGLFGCSQDPAGSAADDQGLSTSAGETVAVGQISDSRIISADEEPGNWLAHGRDFSEQRFSPLTQINTETVSQLSLEFEVDVQSNGAMEATPIMVDGILYFSAPYSITYAVDATTGEQIWRYDPEVPREFLRRACCGPISRGVAVYEGNVYIATLDGRLVAVSADAGEKVWEIDTIIDRDRNYSITGAPRAAKGKIFIGNGGAEFGVRGYVSAFDANTGDLVWRFYTVPGDPSQPFEHPEMELAADTWKGGEWWKAGGGGTVWNSIVYDPEFNHVYLGVGNGSPWSRLIRSPGGGDNLFLTCIVAVDADTGEMKWFYQTVPGDNWDYTAVQDMTLADLEVDGKPRKVLMQAPKNGFFYVLDRSNGELLRAHPYVQTTWASHVDMETGRPVENLEMDFSEKPKWILPGPLGGHDWQAMSFDESKGRMYLPTQDLAFLYSLDPEFKNTGFYKRNPGTFNLGTDEENISFLVAEYADEEPMASGNLKAFDPLTGEEIWSVDHPFYWNGGVMATAGDLVFQGDAMGYFSAYHADTGEKLWTHNNYVTMLAPPISYQVDGKQYVAILAGAGANIVNFFGTRDVDLPVLKYGNFGKLFVYSLDGKAVVTRPAELDRAIPQPPPMTASADQLVRGEQLYNKVCGGCHGGGVISSGVLPDLRMMSATTHEAFEAIVLGGMLSGNGMASFADVLSTDETELIRQFVISQALVAREEASSDIGG